MVESRECFPVLDSDLRQQRHLSLLLMGRFHDLCLIFPSSRGCSASPSQVQQNQPEGSSNPDRWGLLSEFSACALLTSQ